MGIGYKREANLSSTQGQRFSDRLTYARLWIAQQRGRELPKTELAEVLGVTSPSYQRYEDGTVVPHPWPGTAVQVAAYDHCIAAHRDEARWIAFIDIDEFLFSPTGEPLTKILPRYESAPGIGVNWVNFGTSGHQRRPAGLVIDNYVHQIRNPSARRVIKSIVNPAETLHAGSCHHFIYRDGFAVDDCIRPIRGPDFTRTDPVPRRWLRINHYVSRSEEDLEQKRAMPRADTGAARTGSGAPAYGDVQDETIRVFAPAVREAVAAAQERIERRRAS